MALNDRTSGMRDSPLPRPSPSAIFKALDDGGVVLSTTDEVYFGVNAVGARIWSLLPPVFGTFGELYDELAHAYPEIPPEQLEADARQFIDELAASGLVVHPE